MNNLPRSTITAFKRQQIITEKLKILQSARVRIAVSQKKNAHSAIVEMKQWRGKRKDMLHLQMYTSGGQRCSSVLTLDLLHAG